MMTHNQSIFYRLIFATLSVFGDDHTVKSLEVRVAHMLNKQDALFFPTGTMCNLAAVMVLFLALFFIDTIFLSTSSNILYRPGAAHEALRLSLGTRVTFFYMSRVGFHK